ncbi:MAG: ferrochelatase, partial [Halobacteriales archaeon]|nr:ferrochelatase [Halobacteriales archaeon]
MTQTGVLLMTFGAVQSVDDLPQYYTNIRGGKAPAEAELADLRLRYERIGGRSPLVEITRRQASALEEALAGGGDPVPVEIGMRHWNPTIEDGVRKLADRGARQIIGLTSGPYDSNVSVASYQRFLEAAVHDVDPTLRT